MRRVEEVNGGRGEGGDVRCLILLKCRIEYKREREGDVMLKFGTNGKEDLIPFPVPHHTPFPFVSVSVCISVPLLTPKHKLPRQLYLLVLTLSLILPERTEFISSVKSSRWHEQENGSRDSRRIYRGVWAIRERPGTRPNNIVRIQSYPCRNDL